jgi:hypothetical protein
MLAPVLHHDKNRNSILCFSREIVSMNRLRRWCVLSCLFIPMTLFAPLRGQAPPDKKVEDKPAEKWLVDRTVIISPAPAPVPALKYRLYPSSTAFKEGNAVPIYLRFAHERTDETKKLLQEKPEEWNKLPLERLPLEEVKKFLEGYPLKYNLRQWELGARRKTADWNYTLDAGDIISLLLPDIQEMRMVARILVLKARVEIAERRFADAVRTLETGFSFSRQVSQGDFLIQSLVGVACASQFIDVVLEFVERPGAPNLYWALAVLPRPLIDLRRANEFEQIFLELQFPDMADLDRPRSAADWDATLVRVRKEFERLNKLDRSPRPAPPGTSSADPAGKSPDLPAARKYLTEVVGLTAANVEAMPPAQILLLYLSHLYHAARDDIFKGSYLPFAQGVKVNREVLPRLKADTEAARIAKWFLPAIQRVQLAGVRLDRKVAVLRVIEALRMHTAAHRGELPDTLDQVTVVPVPDDPGTGRPFEYRRDGATATLISRIPGESLETTGMRYRVTIRK